jgi:hypothetical protein
MKPFILRTFVIAALGLGTTLPLITSVNAETPASDRFFCGTSRNSSTGESVPATIARTKRGNVPMIIWKSTFFATGRKSFTPQARCQEVSRRFQSFYREGSLAYLTTGTLNAQNVICVAEDFGGPCKGLLLTLEPKDNPKQFLQDLLSVRTRATGPVVRGSGNDYIDVEEFLNTAPIQTDPLSTASPKKLSPLSPHK